MEDDKNRRKQNNNSNNNKERKKTHLKCKFALSMANYNTHVVRLQHSRGP